MKIPSASSKISPAYLHPSRLCAVSVSFIGGPNEELEVLPLVKIVRVIAANACPSNNAGGVNEQNAFVREPGTVQVNEAAVGIGVFSGILAMSSLALAGVPRVICTTPGVCMASV
jgi:hypothetical protein